MIITSSRYPPIVHQQERILKTQFSKHTSPDSFMNTRNLNQYQDASRTFKTSSKNTKANKVQHVYHDHVYEPEVPLPTSDIESSGRKPRKGPRGGVTTPFPLKLHNLLESSQWSDIISWQPHGRCFVLHKPKEFLEEVMPHHFRQTKLTSFQRQLNLYGFCRLTSGRDKGGYYHELFLRGRPLLCQRMVRMRIKGTRIKAASSPETEPNFYAMPPALESAQTPSPERRATEVHPINHCVTSHQFEEDQNASSSSPVCVYYPASVSSSSLISEDQRSYTPTSEIPNQIPSISSAKVLSDSDFLCNFEGKAFHYLESFVDSSFDVTNENFQHVPSVPSSVIEQCKFDDTVGLDENISGFEV